MPCFAGKSYSFFQWTILAIFLRFFPSRSVPDVPSSYGLSQIVERLAQEIRLVSELSDARVAFAAKQTANPARFVAVVEAQVFVRCRLCLADRALAAEALDDLFVVLFADPEFPTQMLGVPV